MNIVSSPFLFLFFPIITGLYYLIPRKNGLKNRNIYIVFVSLFFYAYGEPLFIFLLLAMVAMTWLIGKLIDKKRKTVAGKSLLAFMIVMNVAMLLVLGKFNYIIAFLNELFGKELPIHLYSFPLGFSFLAFSSISYVVDIYRGQCKTSDSLLNAALYICIFFKITQGPIISYRRFESQIENRTESFELVSEGARRFSLGLGKKMIIAHNLSFIVDQILSSDISELSLPDAWLGCISYLVYLYFDFSGYSDMAIGLAKVFGFSVPENFNYPYVSTSVAEFWRRFHITLCVWFTDYLYYPIALGPSVRFRKFLLSHNVKDKTAKTIQSIFVPACVWTVTALWHGINLNYAIWGLANCSAMLVESRIKLIKNKKMDKWFRRIGFLLFLFLSMPLISTDSFENTRLFYKAMFFGKLNITPVFRLFSQAYGLFLIIGIIGCIPLLPFIKKKIISTSSLKLQRAWDILSSVLLIFILLISLAYLIKSGTSDFLYQR